MDIHRKVERIETRNDLVAFISALRADFKVNQAEWESETADDYLGAMAAWIQDSRFTLSSEADWQRFGEMLIAAKYYE